jgi:hypothetical protein
MINLIIGLITAVIYTFTTENPGVLATVGWGLFIASYVMFFRHSLSYYLTVNIIAKDKKLTEAFVEAAKRKADGYKDQ